MEANVDNVVRGTLNPQKSMMQVSHQKDLQTKFLHQFNRRSILLFLDGFNQRAFAGVQHTLYSLGTLSADGHVLSNVKECASF